MRTYVCCVLSNVHLTFVAIMRAYAGMCICVCVYAGMCIYVCVYAGMRAYVYVCAGIFQLEQDV